MSQQTTFLDLPDEVMSYVLADQRLNLAPIRLVCHHLRSIIDGNVRMRLDVRYKKLDPDLTWPVLVRGFHSLRVLRIQSVHMLRLFQSISPRADNSAAAASAVTPGPMWWPHLQELNIAMEPLHMSAQCAYLYGTDPDKTDNHHALVSMLKWICSTHRSTLRVLDAGWLFMADWMEIARASIAPGVGAGADADATSALVQMPPVLLSYVEFGKGGTGKQGTVYELTPFVNRFMPSLSALSIVSCQTDHGPIYDANDRPLYHGGWMGSPCYLLPVAKAVFPQFKFVQKLTLCATDKPLHIDRVVSTVYESILMCFQTSPPRELVFEHVPPGLFEQHQSQGVYLNTPYFGYGKIYRLLQSVQRIEIGSFTTGNQDGFDQNAMFIDLIDSGLVSPSDTGLSNAAFFCSLREVILRDNAVQFLCQQSQQERLQKLIRRMRSHPTCRRLVLGLKLQCDSGHSERLCAVLQSMNFDVGTEDAFAPFRIDIQVDITPEHDGSQATRALQIFMYRCIWFTHTTDERFENLHLWINFDHWNAIDATRNMQWCADTVMLARSNTDLPFDGRTQKCMPHAVTVHWRGNACNPNHVSADFGRVDLPRTCPARTNWTPFDIVQVAARLEANTAEDAPYSPSDSGPTNNTSDVEMDSAEEDEDEESESAHVKKRHRTHAATPYSVAPAAAPLVLHGNTVSDAITVDASDDESVAHGSGNQSASASESDIDWGWKEVGVHRHSVE
jgi:hypothetical protein